MLIVRSPFFLASNIWTAKIDFENSELDHATFIKKLGIPENTQWVAFAACGYMEARQIVS
jgi:hypothetical protein